ncbi:hypothetical protein [Klebsiella oxytoca]|uniref:hypothetical protein n=1 Tax=Klebsiella oxytoca TaxID=571 RepID=UPI001B9FE2C7|nr:hypothetical protein [Klebsiella oxytoca]ELQ9022321.1 hypothetical protein [Klebsiella oxytoca]MBX4771843.1 hypothetical protein [Klebsiella oxytoca]MCW9484425.1 hypothetical protein [Klebsiella oxytoca]HBC7468208.1 hypothetical protein [Klebsiella oxytoca]HBM3258355.1 hypothetical protein [Klebsiella oxytoca]
MLNFLIPVKNHAHINDWNNIKNNISSTLKSINNQSDNNWHCYIVCNFGCDLPELPDKNKFTVLFVDLHKKNIQQSDGLKAYYDAIREDKGLRLYTALKRCNNDDFFMVVDYDDYVHKDISLYVNKHKDENGWFINKGYYYSGGNLLVKTNKFDMKCGTSNILKVSLVYEFNDGEKELPILLIKELLGSHRFLKQYMSEKKLKFKSFPFYAALYNIGLPGSTSGTMAIRNHFFSLSVLIRRPDRYIRNALNIRWFSSKKKNLFGLVYLYR